jgi:zinc and cadmium transporter
MALLWIVVSGILMGAISLVGAVTLVLSEVRLNSFLQPLVSFAAGTLLGGALFHLIPAALVEIGNPTVVFLWVAAGFTLFLALEQFLNWHHSHSAPRGRQPLTYLILIADTLHNFIDGLALGAAFWTDLRLGLAVVLAAAAHEIPQELGDFAVLIHGGWSPRRALLYNFVSALACLAGGLMAYVSSAHGSVTVLLPLAAGNFLYIAAADLIPEVRQHASFARGAVHLACFLSGLGLLALVAVFVEA